MVSEISFFAKNKEAVSKAAIDFYSFGHILIGYFGFIYVNVILLIFFKSYQHFLTISVLFFCALFWEIIENSIFVKKNIKFGYRRDSLINSIMDIIFFVFGGILALLIFLLGFYVFLFSTLMILCLIIIIMKVYAEKILKKKLDFFLIFRSKR